MKKSTMIIWSMVAILCIWLLPNIGVKETNIEGTCVNKYLSFNKNGFLNYHIVYEVDEGYIDYGNQIAGFYYDSEIGQKYILPDFNFYWKPSLKNK